MRYTPGSQSLVGLLTALLLVVLDAPAKANDAEEVEEPRLQRGSEIVLNIEKPSSEESWFRSHFHIEKGRGIAYRRNLMTGDRAIELSLHAPLMKRTTFGLGFEIRF